MYVEVIYLKDNQYQSRKWQHYPVNEVEKIFNQVVEKMMANKNESLVCLRNDDHGLIKSKRI